MSAFHSKGSSSQSTTVQGHLLGIQACPFFLWLILSPVQSQHDCKGIGSVCGWNLAWEKQETNLAQRNAAIYYDTEFFEVTQRKGIIWPPFRGRRPKAGGVVILSGGCGDTLAGVRSPRVREKGSERSRISEWKERSSLTHCVTSSQLLWWLKIPKGQVHRNSRPYHIAIKSDAYYPFTI